MIKKTKRATFRIKRNGRNGRNQQLTVVSKRLGCTQKKKKKRVRNIEKGESKE